LQYAGYQNNGTAFSPGLKANLDYVDQSFARILAALNSSGNAATTGLVITAKHGQQPVTTNATLISPTPIATALKNQNIRCCKLQVHRIPDQVVRVGRSTSVMV
jgi:membrane-anchored protein YejM (alkaline phosphatase superfamily)